MPEPDVDVTLLVAPAAGGAAARGLLREAVARYCGVRVTDVRTGSSCPECGSSGHGRPYAHVGGRPGPYVSLSRTEGLAAVAVTSVGPVGVDVETVAAARFPGFDDVALHPAERAPDDAGRALVWARKEAVLKAFGRGLGHDPRDVRVSDPDEPPRLLSGLATTAWMYDLALPPGLVGVIAVLAAARPVLTVAPAAPAAPAATASR